ncbi:unnamed protein product [Spirodela intermedia]|uniref:Coiled-coil domain-containing protein n=2 Tax=Spirodela intermedia TaxID=51605 RepID=A0A7I8K4S1_SPIIN|nr:unnamed protein product [Spirodela intermedia]CAA6656049.1 unnamed protein product [Spirodela intermedia]CAA7391481.1 unnamed protein product [Spirodela intermedia]
MPKKMGINSKAEAARTRRSEAESDRKEKVTREKEEQYWKEAEGSKSRAAKKREDEAEKRAEIAARKAENRKLAEMEQQEIERAMRKPDKKVGRVSIPVPKVTEADLRRLREEEHLRLQREAEAAKKKQIRTTEEEEYERMVLVNNTNRDDSLIEAHSVEEAIAKISVAEPAVLADRHPERRLKASFKAFEEAELPKLKEEKPGLTLTQYRDMIWKLWQRSPDNPLNRQVPLNSTSTCPSLHFSQIQLFCWETRFSYLHNSFISASVLVCIESINSSFFIFLSSAVDSVCCLPTPSRGAICCTVDKILRGVLIGCVHRLRTDSS